MVTVEVRYEHLEKTIRGYNISADLGQIKAAYEYARKHHGEQMRRDGSPYITHPIQVAQIVAEMRLDSESIIAALHPADSKNFYYALGDDETHHFFRTYDQLQSFIASQERYKS